MNSMLIAAWAMATAAMVSCGIAVYWALRLRRARIRAERLARECAAFTLR